ncbi:vacuolar transporter chaperone [Haplosporangium sp. Z 767]|nr:vacuolar transporter chaperone [Haplosporangium sp. Z 767]
MNTARGQQMQTARSITPQPWHPDYRRDSTHNPLDLPEHRRNSSTESSLGLNEIDSDDRNQDKRDGTKLHKTRKNIFARLGRSRTKVLTTYKISGTGRTAQFSNERLYLHWIRFGILQGGIAVTLLSYGNEVGSWVGVGTLTLALLTLVYSTSLYHTRHIHMITKRKDVVYFAKTIPTLLCVGLILLYGGNFIVAMSMGDAAASRPPWTTDDPYSFTSVF